MHVDSFFHILKKVFPSEGLDLVCNFDGIKRLVFEPDNGFPNGFRGLRVKKKHRF